MGLRLGARIFPFPVVQKHRGDGVGGHGAGFRSAATTGEAVDGCPSFPTFRVCKVDVGDSFFSTSLPLLAENPHEDLTFSLLLAGVGVVVVVESCFTFVVPAGNIFIPPASGDGSLRCGGEHIREGSAGSGLVSCWIREVRRKRSVRPVNVSQFAFLKFHLFLSRLFIAISTFVRMMTGQFDRSEGTFPGQHVRGLPICLMTRSTGPGCSRTCVAQSRMRWNLSRRTEGAGLGFRPRIRW